VETTYDSTQQQLTETSVYLLIPGFDRVALVDNVTVSLTEESSISVGIPNTTVQGTVKFSKTATDVLLSWDVLTPFAGHLSEEVGFALFPVS
jgi:hypothetical protein